MTARNTVLTALSVTALGIALASGAAPAAADPPGTSPAAGTAIRVSSADWVSPSTGWVLGTTGCGDAGCTTVARTTDAGATWTRLAAPKARLAPSGGTGVDEIEVADADNAWAYYPQLHVTHDGGTSWTRLAVPGGGTQVLALTTTGGYAYAAVSTCVIGNPSSCSGPGSIWRTPVGQDAWSQVSATLPDRGFPALTSAGGTVYVNGAGADGTPYLLASTNGTTFTARPVPCADPQIALLRLAPTSSSNLFELCSENVGLGKFSKVAFASTDTGRTATRRGEADIDGQPLTVAAQGRTALIGVSGGDSHLLRSADAGRTWTRVFTGPSETLADAELVGRTGSVVSGPAYFPTAAGDLLLSRDGGASWAVVPVTV